MCNNCINQTTKSNRGGFIPLIVGGVLGYGIGTNTRPNYYQYPPGPIPYQPIMPYPYQVYPYYQQNYYYQQYRKNRTC